MCAAFKRREEVNGVKKIKCFVLAALMLLSLTACGAQKNTTKTVYAMDTVMNLTAYGRDAEAALNEAEQTLCALDKLLDRHDEGSAVSALNRGETVENAEISTLLEKAASMRTETNGAFDPTLAPVLEAWGFGSEHPRVPPDDELAVLLQGVGTDPFYTADGDALTLSRGVQIDLGGIAKGYAGDCVKAIFEAHGCTGVIDLGGDVVFAGMKEDGSPWRIAIKDPNKPSDFLGTLSANNECAVVTSGVYERSFTENGVTYHHIIDPATGKPAESGLVSVTVICGYGEAADALSTALFVMGADKAEKLCAKAFSAALSSSVPSDRTLFSYLLVTDDGRVLYSNDLADDFIPNTESGYTYEKLPPALTK